jgi:hypothetical protein
MNKEESNDQCPAAAARVVGLPMMNPVFLDAIIASELGFFVEMQDETVKCWKTDGPMPDETNWVPGVRFTLLEKLCLQALEKRGIAVSVLPGDTGGWVCSYERNGELLCTSAQSDEGCALALALYDAIRDAKIVKTDC